MRAIILAAGRGSRMESLTDEKPKCLLELRGKPLLEWQLEAIRGAGIQQIGIVTGYKKELLENRGLSAFHNSRWAETQMVSSLVCAEQWLQEGPCIVSYSDIFYDRKAVEALIHHRSDIAVTYDPNWLGLWKKRFGDPLLDAETFRLNANSTLAEIGGRPNSIEEVEGQYMGLLYFSPKGWRETMRIWRKMSEKERDRIQMTATLQKVIEAGSVPVQAVPCKVDWGEVDSASDLKSYEK